MRAPKAHLPALLLVVVLALVTAACSATAPSSPTIAPLDVSSFSAQYDTGSVPPPYNYTQRVEGTFRGGRLGIHYLLTYNFRDALTPSELEAAGYSANDNIDWTTDVAGPAEASWRSLLLATQLGPIPPLAPGSDSFNVDLTQIAGGHQNGLPQNRDAWQAAIGDLDRQARQAAGSHRPEP